MNDNNFRCPKCGGQMVHIGTENQMAIYRCKNCGYVHYVQLSSDHHTDYLHKRSALLGRVKNGIIEWKITQWDVLRRDISGFTTAYDMARKDIGLKMAVIACLTKGFHDMDNEEYKECKRIFKITEKVYKQYTKNPGVVPEEMSDTGSLEYEEYRRMYRACKYDYLGRKTAYKLLFKIFKIFINFPQI